LAATSAAALMIARTGHLRVVSATSRLASERVWLDAIPLSSRWLSCSPNPRNRDGVTESLAGIRRPLPCLRLLIRRTAQSSRPAHSVVLDRRTRRIERRGKTHSATGRRLIRTCAITGRTSTLMDASSRRRCDVQRQTAQRHEFIALDLAHEGRAIWPSPNIVADFLGVRSSRGYCKMGRAIQPRRDVPSKAGGSRRRPAIAPDEARADSPAATPGAIVRLDNEPGPDRVIARGVLRIARPGIARGEQTRGEGSGRRRLGRPRRG
jgi:hypothetical protein